MKDWKALSAEGRAEEIIEEARFAKEPSDFFLLVSSYLALGKGKEAMKLLEDNRSSLFKANPLLALKANFETRFLLQQFDEAYKDLEVFSNFAYVSQAVEEELRALPSRIRQEELASRGKPVVEEEQMHEALRCYKDPATLLAHLNALKKSDLMPYMEDLHCLLEQEDVHDDVKSFALMLLSSRHDETTVSFEKGGKRFTLIPAEVRMPYAQKEYAKIRSELTALPDPSLANVSGELLDQFVLSLYPEIYAPEAKESKAFVYLACRYLGRKEQENDLVASKRANEIDAILSKSKPLSI